MGKEELMKKRKFERRRRMKRWSENRIKHSGIHKEGMNALYGASSPTRQQSLSNLRRQTPITIVTSVQLDAARSQGIIKTRDGDIDSVSPLVRAILRREAELGEKPSVRCYTVRDSTLERVELLREVRTGITRFFCHIKTLNISKFSIDYPSESRALQVWNAGNVFWKEIHDA